LYLGEEMTLVQAVRILSRRGLVKNRWLRGMEVEAPGVGLAIVLEDSEVAPSIAWVTDYAEAYFEGFHTSPDWEKALVEHTPANFGCFVALAQEAFQNLDLNIAVLVRSRCGDAPLIANRDAYFEWVCMFLVVLADEVSVAETTQSLQ
jgi:hypothetical protein